MSRVAGPDMPDAIVLFSSTRPVRGGTVMPHGAGSCALFQSTRPVRGGTSSPVLLSTFFGYFNPPAPCGAGRRRPGRAGYPRYFNPPAPCGAGRKSFRKEVFLLLFQSTRPVRGGTRRPKIPIAPPRRFQSTRPVRGGTSQRSRSFLSMSFQSTRPVRGGTAGSKSVATCILISIHPPRAGRDLGLLFA